MLNSCELVASYLPFLCSVATCPCSALLFKKVRQGGTTLNSCERDACYLPLLCSAVQEGSAESNHADRMRACGLLRALVGALLLKQVR